MGHAPSSNLVQLLAGAVICFDKAHNKQQCSRHTVTNHMHVVLKSKLQQLRLYACSLTQPDVLRISIPLADGLSVKWK